MEYDRAARKRLGRAVRAARINAGYPNRADFADKLKRSTRQVQALENGEDGVGPDTWAAAAEVLGWPLEELYAILDGAQPERPESSSTALAVVSDEELAAEVLRRMRKAGELGGRDTPAMKLRMRPAARRTGGPTDEEQRALKTAREMAEDVVEDSGTLGDEGTA